MLIAAAVVLATGELTQNRGLSGIFQSHLDIQARYEPVKASTRGDTRFNRSWPEMTLERYAAELTELKQIRDRLRAIQSNPGADTLNRNLLLREVSSRIEEIALGCPLMDSDHEEGEQLAPQRSVALLPFNTLSDYEDYIARLNALPRHLRQLEVLFAEGRRRGLIPPKHILLLAAKQCQEVASVDAEASVFSEPLRKVPEALSPEQRKEIRERILDAVRRSVQPAYRRLATFYAEEYAPYGTDRPGLWNLPNGAQLYQRSLRFWTTTDLTADQIHKQGLSEVKRLSALMQVSAKKMGFRSLSECREALTGDARYRARSAEQLFALAKAHTDAIRPHLPKLFRRIPSAELEVRAIPAEHLAGDIGYYDAPALDGSRPGIYWVAAGNYSKIPLFSFEAITYHEALPGHHMQFAVAQEIKGLPAFRRSAEYGAFVEGWALYAEKLAEEHGMYKDPVSAMGRMSQEMVRACRMVVDTGVHSKKWSRETVVRYLRRYTLLADSNIESEADRYIAWPGQAVSYKVGELQILKLREHARRRLGKKFDIRGFHDCVLGGGALPLVTLIERVDDWIASHGS